MEAGWALWVLLDNPSTLRALALLATDLRATWGSGIMSTRALAHAAPGEREAVLDTFMAGYVATFCGAARFPDLVHLAPTEIEWTVAEDEETVIPIAIVRWCRFKSRALSADPRPRQPAILPKLPEGMEELCPYEWLAWWMRVRHVHEAARGELFAARRPQQHKATLQWITAQGIPVTRPREGLYSFKSAFVAAMR